MAKKKKEVKQNKKIVLEKHKILLKGLSDNIGKGKNTMQSKMIEQGYSESYAKSGHIKDTRSWDVLLKDELTDGELMQVHKSLLKSARLDHMVFATGPRDEADKLDYIERARAKAKKDKKEYDESIEYITDDDIKEMLYSTNCLVRRIVHRDTARDVYFWSPDNMARDKALDKGYKLKGKYEPEELNLKFKGFSKEQLIDSIMGKLTKKK